MKPIHLLSTLIIYLINCQFAFGQERPEWITTPPESTLCKKYFVGDGQGRTVTEAKAEAYNDINRQVAESVRVKISIDKQRDLNVVINNKVISQDEKIKNITKIVGEGIVRGLHRLTTHEEEDHTGTFRVWFLYELESGDDECMPRQAKARALVPSWGQFYKHQGPKGGAILAGIAVVTAGYFICSSRATYYSQQAQLYNTNPIIYAQYKQNQRDWEKGMIGASITGGLLYVYNLVDAWATKGPSEHEIATRRRTAQNTNYWHVKPYCTLSHVGFSVSYSLSPNR